MRIRQYLDLRPTHDADWMNEGAVKCPIAGEAFKCRDAGR